MPSELEITPFHLERQQTVVELWRRCGLLVPWNDPAADISRKMNQQPELFLTGILSETVVATVMAGYEGHRGWINYLAVAPEYRGRGFGRQMMTAAEERLSSLGCPKINLQIRAGNSAAAAFYQGLGYRKDEVISMGKRLQRG